jgi:hypothetical protein
VPSRSQSKSSSKNTLPATERIRYYRCNYCGYVGVIVTNKTRFNCGSKRCREYLQASKVKANEEDYRRVWE